MKLLLAAPCNLVSNDPELGHSLIGVFHDIMVRVIPGAEIPNNAVLPKEWAIFSKWSLDPGEEGRNHFLVTEIYWPDGSKLSETRIKSLAPGVSPSISFIVRSQGFPFGQAGKIKINLRVEEEDGTDIKIAHEAVEIEILVRIEKDLALQ
jgi:hypothetical protein